MAMLMSEEDESKSDKQESLSAGVFIIIKHVNLVSCESKTGIQWHPFTFCLQWVFLSLTTSIVLLVYFILRTSHECQVFDNEAETGNKFLRIQVWTFPISFVWFSMQSKVHLFVSLLSFKEQQVLENELTAWTRWKIL